MKKFYTLLVLTFVLSNIYAQDWIKNLPQDKLQNGELTFYEIQNAFNDYWEPFNVINGYYDRNGEQVKAPMWKQFKRWEWFWENRIDLTTGEFPNTSAWEELQKHLKEYPEQKSPTGNWTSMGPSTTSGGYAGLGRLNCVAFASSDANRIYVGSPSGGIWKTTNGGSAWTPLGDNNAVLGVSDIICIDPVVGPDILYIATGDRDGGSMWSLGGGQSNDNNSVGVLKSVDGGVTWNTTGLSFTASQKRTVNRMLVDPTSTITLYAATSVGLYKTTDGGTNWTLLNGTNFVDIKFKPGTPSTIYASTWSGDIQRSTNSGVSFSTVHTTGNGRVELAVTANNSNVVYALMESGGGLGGVYKSTDGGGSFSSTYTGPLNFMGWNCNGGDSGGQGGYDLCIAADPNDANNVFVGGVNTWNSTDGGTNWDITTHWSSSCSGSATNVHADQHYLAYQNGTSTLYLCNDGGLYKTVNNGSSWTHHGSGLVTSQLYRLGVAQTSSTEVICGLQDNGTKANLSGSWNDVIGGDGMECAIDYTNHNTQYGESQYGNLLRTTNQWSSYSPISGGLTGSKYWVMPFVIDANVNTTIYAGTQDVFKSTNQGNSWTSLSSWGGSTIRSLSVTPASSNVICAATSSTLYRTTNGGSSWTTITGSLPTGSASITYVWIKDTDANTIWVSLGGYNSFGVYESTDGGSSWANISSGLPSLPVMCVIQNKQNTAQDELYAGTDIGIYVKVGAANWTPFYNGLPNVVVAELDIYYDNVTPANSRLRAATFGRGMWESDLYTNPVPDTWTGTVNSNWNLGGNWLSGSIPTALTNVTIPGAPANWPTKTGNLTLGSDCQDLTMAANAQLTVTGDFTINTGRTFVMNTASKIMIEGDWNNNGTFTPGMGIVDFSGSSASVLNPAPGGAVNLINDNISTWPGNWNGDIGAGNGQFDQNPSSFAGGSTPEIRFYWQNIVTTKRVYYNSVNTSGLTSVDLTFNHSVDDFSGSGYTVKVQYSTDGTNWFDSNWSLSPSGSISGTPVTTTLTSASHGVGSSTYYIAFTIDGNLYNIDYWYIDDVVLSYNMPGTETFFDLAINKSTAEVTTNGNLTIGNDLTVSSGSDFTNATGNTITVTGDAIFEATSSGMASYLDNGTTTINGQTFVQQYLTSERWHQVSPPVSGSTINTYFDIYLKEYNEPSNDWTYLVTPTTTPLSVGKGYSAWASDAYTGTTTISFTGSMTSSDVNLSGFSYSPGTNITKYGFHLIGNPYPCALDWNSNWSMSNMSGWMVIYDNGTYRGKHTSGSDYNSMPSSYIPSTQGFWVRALNSSASITIPASERAHSGQAFYKGSFENIYPEIRLSMEINGYSDEAAVIFHPEATDGFDGYYDLAKFENVAEAPQLFTITSDGNYAFNFYGPEYAEKIIPVGFSTENGGLYTITAASIENFESEVGIYLEDLQTGEYIKLTDTPEYDFVYDPQDEDHRFNLHFTYLSVAVDEMVAGNIRVYSADEAIYINNPEGMKGYVYIYDMIGKEVYQGKLQPKRTNQILLDLGIGHYVVKVITGSGYFSEKVLIK